MMRVTVFHFGGIGLDFQILAIGTVSPAFNSNAWSANQPSGLAGGFLAGANLLPAARALVVRQNLFAQADGFGRNFHVFIVSDEFDGLLQAKFTMRNQADGFIRAGGAHVGEFFFARDVYFHVLLAGIFADDHAFVHVDGWPDEKFATLLNIPKRIGGGNSGAVSNQRARRAQRHFAAVFDPIVKDGVDQRGSARIGQQLAAQAD